MKHLITTFSLCLILVTAYSEYDSCHYKDCKVASGERASMGMIACPRRIKLGTKVWIETMGTFTCADRYNKGLSDRFDIFFGYGQGAYEDAKSFGKKNLKFKILI